MSSLRHRTHLIATTSKICTWAFYLRKERYVTLAKGIHFTGSKTQLVRNIRSKVLKKTNEESLRDTSIENHLSLEEKGRNRAEQIKQGSQVPMAQTEFPLC